MEKDNPEMIRLPELPADLRGPLAAPRLYHPENWGPAAGQLTAFAVLACFLMFFGPLFFWPNLAPPHGVAFILAALALAIFLVIAAVGRQRGGSRGPRWAALFFVLAAAGATLYLGLGLLYGQESGPHARILALSLMAGAGCLALRICLGHLSPLERFLAYAGVAGLLEGVFLAILLRFVLPAALALLGMAAPLPGPFGEDRRQTSWCAELASLAGHDLRPVLRGEDARLLEKMAQLHLQLAASSDSWQNPSAATRATCDAAAAALATILEAGPPTPADLADPVFAHAARPAQAGVRSAQLPLDPTVARQLYRELGFLTAALAARLDRSASPVAGRLGKARAGLAETLASSWLESWLLNDFQGADAASENVLEQLLRAPGQPPARLDAWLGLSFDQARRVALEEPACAMREPYEGPTRRQQVLDCVLLGVSAKGQLDLIGELGLVYSSVERRNLKAPLPQIAGYRHPDSLRLLFEIPGGPAARPTRQFLDELGAAVTRTGASFHRTGDWSFEIRYESVTVLGGASDAELPGGRPALHLSFRLPGES